MTAEKNRFESSNSDGNKKKHRGNHNNDNRMRNAGLKNAETKESKQVRNENRSDNNAATAKTKQNNRRNGIKRYPPRNNAYTKKRNGNRTVGEYGELDDIKTSGGHYVDVDFGETEYDDKPIENIVRDECQKYGNRYSSPLPGAVIGRNAVRELLKSNRSIDKIYVKTGDREGSITVLVAEAVSRGIPIVEVDAQKLDQMAGGSNHQGVIAAAAEKEYTDVDGILLIAKERGETPLIVIADGIEDPHNLGAIIRCAECSGAHGIIIPKRRAVGLTPTVTKASAGAIEHMAIAKVNNINQAIEKLKKNGIWIFAAEAGGTPYYDIDFNVPAAIVLGCEGTGVSRLIKEQSDYIASIPMYGSVNSLNVSTAAAVLLCHAARMQRGNSK